MSASNWNKLEICKLHINESITERSDNNPRLEIQTAPLIQFILDIQFFYKMSPFVVIDRGSNF